MSEKNLDKAKEGAEAVEKAFDTLGDKKTRKGAKELKGMLSQLGPVGNILSMLPGFEAVLKPIMMLLKPFEPFLKIIGGMLSAFFGQILAPIMEALKPLFEMMMEFMPIFVIVGKVLGLIIGTLIKALMPVFEALMPTFMILAKVIGILMVLALIPLITAIYAVGIAIAAMIDLFTFGAAGAMAQWNDLMLPAIGGALGAIPEIMALQHGGYVPARVGGTIVRVGEGREGEHVIPGSEMGEMISLQENTNRYLKLIYKDKAWRHSL